jgi:hypothetical protein
MQLEFKIRASAASQIMTKARSGSGLSETAKTYCETWLKEQIYSRPKMISSKYFDKGNAMESDAIEFAAMQLGWGLVYKNEVNYTDSDLIGTPDLVLTNLVPDIKCSWDCFSFPLFENELPVQYYWQLQTYMALTGMSKGMIVYCLMDAPDYLIEREAWVIARSRGESELDMELFDLVKARMTYSGLPVGLRLKTFEIERNDAAIASLRERVELCREYIGGIML